MLRRILVGLGGTDYTVAGFDLVPDPHDALVRLVQAGARPLIAVAKGFYPVKRVLIAYSGSMESAKAMKRFVQMRLWFNIKEQMARTAAECDCRVEVVEQSDQLIHLGGVGCLLSYRLPDEY